MNNNATNFNKYIEIICKKNPLQKKAINNFLNKQDNIYWMRAELFAQQLSSFIDKQNISIEYIVDAYLRICRDMLVEQIKFRKSGKYSCTKAIYAKKKVYLSEVKMKPYMFGLALSQFLWPNHYLIYDFFIKESKKLINVSSYLEIGPGHGLFLIEAIKMLPTASFLAVDISPISKQISQEVVQHFLKDAQCKFRVQDVNQMDTKNQFDYIVMNEVLEHLDNPRLILKKIHNMLHDKGNFFMTTCANCPAIDHVYLYDSITHIRRHIQETGFEIISDFPIAVGDYDENEWENKKVEINYAAMLKKA